MSKTGLEAFIAYFGRYTVDDAAGIVTHRVQGALFPNWMGGDQQRYFTFNGNRLTLRTPPILAGGSMLTGVLIWERMI